MGSITSYERLEDLGRVRLSQHFFMRDFLYSEIAAWHGLRNVPDHPEQAVAVGKLLCEHLLEPLQATFGRIHIRSAYRSPQVNKFGNENKLNCASNESNYAGHIWDYPDAQGKRGATACIVIPWLVDFVEKGGSWTAMAWWIHDHLPYSSLYFFPRLSAFNINWHEAPVRRIDSYAPPKGCLTQPGMPNHQGSHASEYAGFPTLARAVRSAQAVAAGPARAETDPVTAAAPSAVTRPMPTQEPASPVAERRPAATTKEPPTTADTGELIDVRPQTGGTIMYRAIHTRNLWRRAANHRSLENAIYGKDGAAGLFARKARIDYAKNGDPLYVLAWESGAGSGFVIKADPAGPKGIRVARAPMKDLLGFEARGQAGHRELEKYFVG